ncbi:hypothetical protein CCACVL1_12236 [Corchorus capsularis]|uniref:Myb/SANT-like domain-containing protein n=1 Tax=Corchorus capsularis TaxID=210143 RepID=A0A1R3IGR4_COCAP|nr:hypothetical protein CCACVL1_12236 [Corchorus capsularis]
MAAKKSRRWLLDEDAALIAAMVDMRNVGRFNADTGFKGGYLLELERMLHESLPQANIKAKPHIESRIRTLKKEWGIIYDMINGTNTSGFGWDDHRKMLTAEDKVWDDFMAAHPRAAQFRVRTFPYFSELTAIYAKDHATGKDAQTAADILEEMAQETEGEAADQDAEMESNNVVQDDTGLDEMDVSTTPSMPSKRRREYGEFEPISADCIISAAKLIGDGIREAGKDLSKSIGSEMVIQEKVQELNIILGEIDGLTEEERDIALNKIPDHPAQMLVFGSLPPHRKLAWVKRFLSSH